MQVLRVLVLAVIAASVVGGVSHAAQTTATISKLEQIYLTAYDEAINRHAVRERDGTTYVSTGDIEAEWLRDASAVMEPYVGLAVSDETVHEQLHGVVARQARYILIDPYANAFSSNYSVVERKFEIDSLLYPIWFADHFWRGTGDRTIFTPQVGRAFARVLKVLRDEQRHDKRSGYRHPDLAENGRGTPVKYTGMIWTGFRPSDDPARYQYNIPDNMFAVVVLKELSNIETAIYRDRKQASNAWGLAMEVQRGIEQYGVCGFRGYGKIYAYEVDGLGHANLMDDANVPSLLSVPYFGYAQAGDPIYQNTRRFVLSPHDPYYFAGKVASGIGSPHTPKGNVWPLALVMQALTSRDPAEVERVLGYLAASDIGDHRLHESFNADWPEQFTRDDFAWPNALYAELVQTHRGGGAAAFFNEARRR
jgi:meiotically up-regulated gene 157 (Mug157) protein